MITAFTCFADLKKAKDRRAHDAFLQLPVFQVQIRWDELKDGLCPYQYRPRNNYLAKTALRIEMASDEFQPRCTLKHADWWPYDRPVLEHLQKEDGWLIIKPCDIKSNCPCCIGNRLTTVDEAINNFLQEVQL